MAVISFSEKEIKRLILALAGSKAEPEEVEEPEAEKPEEPKEKDMEDKPSDKEEAGKPHGEKVDTKEMLRKKLEGEK